jgi:hypothetical protein
LLLLAVAASVFAQYSWFTTGQQRTIVAVVGPSSPDSIAMARDMVFGADSVNAYYKEASNNQMSFVGETIGLNVAISGCDLSVLDAALAAQVDVELYRRRIYFLIGSTGCGWMGFSDIGISHRTPGGMLYSQTQFAGFPNQQTLFHEVGHGLGLSHAATYNPYTATGDSADPLGGGRSTLNGPHKAQLSWMTVANILDVTQDGTFTLTALESSTGLQMLRIPRAVTEFGSQFGANSKEYLYVSYRRPIGFYGSTIYPGMTTGASVHVVVVPEFGAWKTLLVDDSYGSLDFFNDAALNDSGSVSDSLNKILVTQVSHTDVSTTVRVTFNAANPTPPPPPPPTAPLVSPTTVTLSANQTQQFTTTISGASWRISPAVGSITQTGLYRAPSRVKGQRSIVVIAGTSDASGTAAITLVK